MGQILLMEDCTLQAMMMRDWLEMEGHEVEIAANLDEAVATLSNLQELDCVVTDLFVGDDTPKAAGADLIEHLRTHDDPYLNLVPIITISGSPPSARVDREKPDDQDHSQVSNVDMHFTKPIDLSKLTTGIQSLIGGDLRKDKALGK